MCKRCYDGYDFPDHRERNVYRLEDEYETPYQKSGKGKKFCKRAKGKTPHDWTGRLTIMVTKSFYDYETERWKRIQVPKTYIVCARCGKGKTYISRWA